MPKEAMADEEFPVIARFEVRRRSYLAPDGTMLCLYENGEKSQYEKITLARFTLDWLTDGKDALASR